MSNSESEDNECLARASRGDPSAREQLFDQHRDRLKRMVTLRLDRRILKRVDPSDIIQEALFQANQKLEEYLRERPIPFYPWLRQLAWDQLVTAYRRHVIAHRRSTTREDFVPDLSDESVAELASFVCDLSEEPLRKLLRAEAQGRLRDAINQLGEQDREILVLRYLEQLSTADTAAILKLGLSAVKMRHLRAIERMRELLGNQPLDPST
jgi:RNA polymerase sigma-70 factor, ECF subfamily